MVTHFEFFKTIAMFITLSSCTGTSTRSDINSPKSFLASSSKLSLDGVDVYGSKQITLEMIENSHGELLKKCLDESILEGRTNLECDRENLTRELLKHYDLAFARLSIVKYFNLHNIPGRQAYATIDLVEKPDAQRRMKFLPRPHGHHPDPDDLLKAWDEYQQVGFELLNAGEISGAREECPAFHCIFGHKHTRLAPFRDVFVTGVARHKKELIRVFLDDNTDLRRATATFLLAYISDGNELVRTLSKRINDESESVRNNVIRVFSDIAAFHQDLALPIEAIVPILDYPETTDRNKASMVIFGLTSNKNQLPKYRHLIVKEAVPTLLQLLRLKQPNNHDPAYLILRTLSNMDYGERDYTSWENWYRSQME